MSENTNNIKITCEICRDLIPLVQDGVASAESEEAVKAHIAECSECAPLLDEAPADKAPESPLPTKGLKSAKRYLTVIYSCLMLLGLYVGLSLTGGEDLFANTLIMPIAGALGYLAFRLRALYIVPALLLMISVIANALGIFAERADLIDLLGMAFIYFLFALGGIIVAMLYKFAIFGIKKGAK